MKRLGWLMSVIVLAGLLTACGLSTLEVGVDAEATTDAAGSEEADAPLQVEPTEEVMSEESMPEEEPSEEPMPEEEMIEAESDPDAAFGDEIIGALNGRDDAALVAAMRDPFMMGLWRSEGFSVSPNDAPQQIYNYLPEGAVVQHITDEAAFPTLEGIDPTQMFGPDVAVEDVLYTTGWGEDGSGEALIFIARDANGDLYWHGMVIAPMAFDDLSAAPSSGFPVVDALNARDEMALAAMMMDPFAFGLWRTEWQSLTPEEVLPPIIDRLPEGAQLTATTDRAAFPELDGQPAETLLGPDVLLEQVIFVTGWGSEGKGEALLFMARSESGAPMWQAMLFAQMGFD